MKKCFAVLLAVMLFTFCSLSAFAYESPSVDNTAILSGYVTDANGDPVSGATVVLDSTTSTVTDANGYFSFGVVDVGPHTITVTDSEGNTYTTSFTVDGDSVINGSVSVVININGDSASSTVDYGTSGSNDTDNTNNTNNTNDTNNSATPTSPKTGVTVTYAALAVATVLVSGGAAAKAKKKLEE